MYTEFENPLRWMPQPSRYKVDLAAYMRTCDDNYSRLRQLIPKLESANVGHAWLLQLRRQKARDVNGLCVRLELVEVFPFTATIRVQIQHGFPVGLQALSAPSIDVRIYHDAATAEPVSYQGHRRVPVRNEVPNACMYHQDEKRQINEFLAEWLELCLTSGQSVINADCVSAD